jgi:hypothetical protein
VVQLCKYGPHYEPHCQPRNAEKNGRWCKHDHKKLLVPTLAIELRFVEITYHDQIHTNILGIEIVVGFNWNDIVCFGGVD